MDTTGCIQWDCMQEGKVHYPTVVLYRKRTIAFYKHLCQSQHCIYYVYKIEYWRQSHSRTPHHIPMHTFLFFAQMVYVWSLNRKRTIWRGHIDFGVLCCRWLQSRGIYGWHPQTEQCLYAYVALVQICKSRLTSIKASTHMCFSTNVYGTE